MLGAIIGDMSGSRFEWDNIKTKNFELLSEECFPTDDSIMTLAIAKTIVECNGDYTALEEKVIENMQLLGRRYPDAGYGARFYDWLFEENPKPYHSFGNGAAMRVSPCGFAAGTMEEAIALARAVTKVTHNHREGMKAAEAVTVALDHLVGERCALDLDIVPPAENPLPSGATDEEVARNAERTHQEDLLREARPKGNAAVIDAFLAAHDDANAHDLLRSLSVKDMGDVTLDVLEDACQGLLDSYK